MSTLLTDAQVDHRNNKDDAEQNDCCGAGASSQVTIAFKGGINQTDHRLHGVTRGRAHLIAKDTDDA